MPECGQGAGRLFGKINKNPEIEKVKTKLQKFIKKFK